MDRTLFRIIVALIFILIIVLLIKPAYAAGRCDFREPLRGANGAIFKLSSYNPFKSVFVVPSDIPDAIRADVFHWSPRSTTVKCRWKGAGKARKKGNLTSTGRANGDRENLRSTNLIEEFPDKCLYLRVVYDLGTDGRVKHCFSMNKVDPIRND